MEQATCIEKIIKKKGAYFAYRCRGSSHACRDLPCQDAVKVHWTAVGSKPVLILAIADGHGGERYDLSEYGAKLAVETMDALLIEFYKSSGGRAELFKRLRGDFPVAMGKLWRGKIESDFKERFGEEPESDFYKRYGSTALFALAVPEGIFLGQLGDGDIVVAEKYSAQFPMPRHDELVGGQTYSLVSGDAKRYWQIEMCSISCRTLILLSTDGLANSYINDLEFEKFVRSLYDHLQTFSVDALGLENYLAFVSENGSGDDISVAGAVIEPRDFDYEAR